MALPNVVIELGNGNLGRVSLSDDGIAGLVLTGAAVTAGEGEEAVKKLELNKPYTLGSVRDLEALGVTEGNNPLVFKEVNAFYGSAGDGAELHLLVTSEATTLTQMCGGTDESPVKKLINSAAGRIRLLGINRNAPADYTPVMAEEIDSDVKTAVEAMQKIAENYTAQVWPFRAFLPALAWSGATEKLYSPRAGSYNRVGIVAASDGIFPPSTLYSAAIGLVLGRAASIPVHRSIARVRDGAIAAVGFLTDGKTPEQDNAKLNTLNDAGYIFYRTFIGKNGYYLNDDPMCAPVTDDYSNLNLGRVIDKAIILAYQTYIESVMDNILIDEKGCIPSALCKGFEAEIIRAVSSTMSDEISSFTAYVDPAQNVLSTGKLSIQCKIVPQAILREINVNLSFNNPSA